MIIINLLGGPSTGKSTTLYELATKLKKDKINIKTNLEYVKDCLLLVKI
jgi:uridine kinase